MAIQACDALLQDYAAQLVDHLCSEVNLKLDPKGKSPASSEAGLAKTCLLLFPPLEDMMKSGSLSNPLRLRITSYFGTILHWRVSSDGISATEPNNLELDKSLLRMVINWHHLLSELEPNMHLLLSSEIAYMLSALAPESLANMFHQQSPDEPMDDTFQVTAELQLACFLYLNLPLVVGNRPIKAFQLLEPESSRIYLSFIDQPAQLTTLVDTFETTCSSVPTSLIAKRILDSWTKNRSIPGESQSARKRKRADSEQRAPWKNDVRKVLDLHSCLDHFSDQESINTLLARLVKNLFTPTSTLFDIEMVGQLACASSGRMAFRSGEEGIVPTCSFCDEQDGPKDQLGPTLRGQRELGDLCLMLIGDNRPTVQSKSAAWQKYLIVCLGRLISHCKYGLPGLRLSGDNMLVVLITSQLASPVRTMRLAAGSVILGLLLQHELTAQYRRAMVALAMAQNAPLPGDRFLPPEPSIEVLVKHLVNEPNSCKDSARETAMTTLAALGKYVKLVSQKARPDLDYRLVAEEQLGNILICFIEQATSSSSPISGMAVSHLAAISKSRETSPYKLVAPHLSAICTFIMQHPRSTALMSRLTRFIGIPEAQFVARNLDYILPPLILSKEETKIQQIATLAGADVLNILISNAPSILTFLYLRPSANDCKRGIDNFLSQLQTLNSSEASKSITKLVSICGADVLSNLFIELGSDVTSRQMRAEEGFARLQAAHATKHRDSISLQELLTPHLLGILSKLNDHLTSQRGKTSLSDRKSAVAGLGLFIERLGPPISERSPQVDRLQS